MLEYLLFPVVVGSAIGVAAWRKDGSMDDQKVIEKVFENLPVNVKEGKGKNTYVKRPKLIDTDNHEWGTTYKYRLPTGVAYRAIAGRIDMDSAIEDNLGKDVFTEFDGFLHIHVCDKPLPKLVPFEDNMIKEGNKTSFVIGVNHWGRIIHDLSKIPHTVIGGTTRYGKSVLMKLLLTTIAVKASDSFIFHLFDLKGGLAFTRFEKLHCTDSVSSDVESSYEKLKELEDLVDERQKYFKSKGYENFDEALAAGEKIKRHLIVIDEASVLAPEKKNEQPQSSCHRIVSYIAQVAGGLGFNLVMCSQYPTGDILPRQVKQNSDAKIAFRLPTDIGSKVILDELGAESIPHGMRGRAIYKTDGKSIIQVPLIENEDIDRLLEPLKVEDEKDEQECEERERTSGENIVDFG